MRGDGCGQQLSELEASAMDSGSDGVDREVTRRRNLLVPEATDLTEQEDVSIDVGERGQCFIDDDGHVLGSRDGPTLSRGCHRRRPGAPSMMVDDNVSGDCEDPGLRLASRTRRNLGSADTQEDVLDQIARGVRPPGRATEVPKERLMVRGEQCFDV
jgi:hypothetical protein